MKKSESAFVLFLARILMAMLTAIPTTVFYNFSIAWKFNLPTFNYVEVLLGIISIYMLKCTIFNRFKD